jgi:hypothetical protein
MNIIYDFFLDTIAAEKQKNEEFSFEGINLSAVHLKYSRQFQ